MKKAEKSKEKSGIKKPITVGYILLCVIMSLAGLCGLGGLIVALSKVLGG